MGQTCVIVDNQRWDYSTELNKLDCGDFSDILAGSRDGFANSLDDESFGELARQPSVQTMVLSEVERPSFRDSIDDLYPHEDSQPIQSSTNSDNLAINRLFCGSFSKSFFNNSSASMFGDQTIQDNALSFYDMAQALVALEEQIKKKNKDSLFNCCLINCQDNDNELFAFLHFLKDNQQQLHSQRIQVLYLKELHWSLLDIDIAESGLSFILYDDANSLKYIIPLLLSLRALFPEAALAYLGSNFQKDSYSCAYFALHAIEKLAKINDLHQVINNFSSDFSLENSIEDMRKYSDDEWTKQSDEILNDLIEHVKYISILQWPKELGSLVKTLQSRTFFETFIQSKEYHRHNGKSLNDYLTAQTEDLTGIAATKEKINALIHKVKEHRGDYQARIEQLCDWHAFLAPLCADSHELMSFGSILK